MEIIIFLTVVYLIGYVLSYHIMRKYIKRVHEEWDWSDIRINILVCFVWPIILPIWLYIWRHDIKPPKWM